MMRLYYILFLVFASVFWNGCSSEGIREDVIERYEGGEKKILAIYAGKGVNEKLIERISYDQKGKMIVKEDFINNNHLKYMDLYPNLRKSAELKKYLDGGWRRIPSGRMVYFKDNIIVDGDKEKDIVEYLDNARIIVHPEVRMASYSDHSTDPFAGTSLMKFSSELNLISDDEFHVKNQVYKRDNKIEENVIDSRQMNVVVAGGIVEVKNVFIIEPTIYALEVGNDEASEYVCLSWYNFTKEKYGEFPFVKGDKFILPTKYLLSMSDSLNCISKMKSKEIVSDTVIYYLGIPKVIKN